MRKNKEFFGDCDLRKFTYKEVLELLENYDEWYRLRIRQYCDSEDIPTLEDFLQTFIDELGDIFDEEDVKEVIEHYNLTMKCHTASEYTEEFLTKHYGEEYKFLEPFQVINKFSNNGN